MDAKNEESEKRFGRRVVLAGIGIAATGAAATLASSSARAHVPAVSEPEAPAPPETSTPPETQKTDGDVRTLFGSRLREGSVLEGLWRIEKLHALRAGAIPVVLSAAGGARFAVEIFRSGPGPRPIGRAGDLDLRLSNRGDGDTRTVEIQGLGVLALARALSARLAEGAPVPRDLSTHAERLSARPQGNFAVPLE